MKWAPLLIFCASVLRADDLLSIRVQSRLQIDRQLFGHTDTNTDWQYLSGATLNTNCWTWGLDFSGMSIGIDQPTVLMVTSRHGLTAAHVAPSPGAELRFIGTDGAGHTNWVAAVTNCDIQVGRDLCLVTLSNPTPASVHAFAILPTNYVDFGDLGWDSGNVVAEAVWYRRNTGRMNVKMISNWLQGAGFPSLKSEQTATNWYAPAFTESEVTGGDSSSPAFILVNGRPAILFSTWLDDPLGPLVSYPGRPEWIQSVAGTNVVFASLSRYPHEAVQVSQRPVVNPNGVVFPDDISKREVYYQGDGAGGVWLWNTSNHFWFPMIQ